MKFSEAILEGMKSGLPKCEGRTLVFFEGDDPTPAKACVMAQAAIGVWGIQETLRQYRSGRFFENLSRALGLPNGSGRSNIVDKAILRNDDPRNSLLDIVAWAKGLGE